MKGLIDEAEARDAISKTGKAPARAAGKIAGPKSQLEALFNQVTGRAVVAENDIVANLFQANRNIVVSAVLGEAWFSSLASTVPGRGDKYTPPAEASGTSSSRYPPNPGNTTWHRS